MNISKNSWCYKFNSWMCVHLDSDPPSKKSSLCNYFWYTVFNIIKLILIAIVILSTGQMPFVNSVFVNTLYTSSLWWFIPVGFVGLFCIFVTLLLVFGLCYIGAVFINKKVIQGLKNNKSKGISRKET
jgi:cellulose synthase/poly-beta-1,6-N-acetylglucosamine synthase-like glycosyltransferase